MYEWTLEDYKYEYRKLQRENEELRGTISGIRNELDSAKFKIRNELEPRIESEKRSYDNWVTNPER